MKEPIEHICEKVLTALYGEALEDRTRKEFEKVFFSAFYICFATLTEKIMNKPKERQEVQLAIIRDELDKHFNEAKGAGDGN